MHLSRHHLYRRILPAFTGLLLAGAGWLPPAFGEEADAWDLDEFEREVFELGGTIKVLGIGFQLTEATYGEESFEGSGLASLRLKLEGSPRGWLGYELHLSIEDDVTSEPQLAALGGLTEASTPLFRGLGQDVTWSESDTHRLWGEVDYANVRLTFADTDVVIGRQAVTFGRSFFWNPTDWLSTFAPTEIDREYKGGIDAIRLSHGFGRFSGAELVYAYGEGGAWDESALIGRAYANWWNWDFEVLGGRVWIDHRLGFAFSGEVGGAGVRGEWSWHRPREGEEPDFLRATLEVDYKWPSSLLLMAELHYNGFGTEHPEEYAALLRSPRVATGQVANVGRRYLGSQASYELSPLLTATAAVLVNLEDRSGIFNPSFSLSLSDESDLVTGLLIPWGKEPLGTELRSEYGSYFNTFWVQWRWSF